MATILQPLPAWLAIDERRAARWPMNVAAFVRTQVEPARVEVRVADVSTHGCLLAIVGGMSIGRYVTLSLPQIEVEGWIAWSKGDHAGIDFAHPLPPGLLDMIIGRHGCAPVCPQ